MRPTSRLTKHQSKAFLERRRARFGLTIALALVVVGVWVFNVVRLTRVAALSIQEVQIQGADQEIVPALVAAAYQGLDGTYAGLLAKSSTFIFPKKSLVRELAAVSPRIASVSVNRAGWQALAVFVTEKTPVAVVCATLPDFSSPNDLDANVPCYDADAAGMLFRQIGPESLPQVNRYYIPDLPVSASSTGSTIGSMATSTPEFQALQGFMDGVRRTGLMPEGILVKPNGEYELYAHNPTMTALSTSTSDSAIVVIYFNDSRPLSDELSNLTVFWAQKASDAHVAGTSARFASIDVRYGDNVFYSPMP
jgi:hypothetical protein